MGCAVHVRDTVVYRARGVCRIDEAVTKRVLRKHVLKYFVLTPLDNSCSATYVPMKNKKLVEKIQGVLSKEEIYDVIERMP